MAWDPDADRFQDIREVVDEVLHEHDFPSGPIERLEITCLANGEANARVWVARAEEPAGFHYENPDMPRE